VKVVAVAVLVSAALAVSAAVPATDLPPALRSLLSKQLKFTPSELAELEMGRVVAHRMGATAAGEAGAAGAVRVQARKEAFVDLYRDIVNFKRGPDVMAIGLFHDPPSVSDLESLPLDARDVNLRSCRVADCDIRLPAATILRFQHDVDWRSPDADGRAAALFKDVLVEHVRAYVSGGSGIISEYDDEKRPVRPREEFAALLAGARAAEASGGILVESVAGRRGRSLLVEGEVRQPPAVCDGDSRRDRASRPGELRHRVEGCVLEPVHRRLAIADHRE
jgi:hypothetical protein